MSDLELIDAVAQKFGEDVREIRHRGFMLAGPEGSAVAAGKRDLISGLPKMLRAGRTDVSDPKVSVYALTPVSEPLSAVA